MVFACGKWYCFAVVFGCAEWYCASAQFRSTRCSPFVCANKGERTLDTLLKIADVLRTKLALASLLFYHFVTAGIVITIAYLLFAAFVKAWQNFAILGLECARTVRVGRSFCSCAMSCTIPKNITIFQSFCTAFYKKRVSLPRTPPLYQSFCQAFYKKPRTPP